MSSLQSPPLKRTSGTAAELTRASSSDTRRSWLRLSAAGDGMGKPPFEQELHHTALVLEPRDVTADPDAVHRCTTKADVAGQ